MKEFYKALASFQNEVPIIHKGTKGYNYSYADLATIIEKITPVLKKHNLGYTQLIQESKLHTTIFHTESGLSIESLTDLHFDILEYQEIEKIKYDKKSQKETKYKVTQLRGFEGMNEAQAYGSLITYFRRYTLTSMLGLVTDSDADARNKRIEDQNKELPVLHPNNKKDWDNIVKVLATKQYTLQQVQTKWTVSEEHYDQINTDIKTYISEQKQSTK